MDFHYYLVFHNKKKNHSVFKNKWRNTRGIKNGEFLLNYNEKQW